MRESNPFSETVAGLGPAALRDLLTAAAARLSHATSPAIVSGEVLVELHGRATRPLVIPQWTTVGPDGELQPRGVVIQALDYKARRLAEQKATIERGPRMGEVDEWRRMLEEVSAGIVGGPQITTLERMNYEVIRYIHAAIDRLGDDAPAIVAAELAQLAGGQPPARPADPRAAVELGHPDDLGGEPGA